MPNSSANLKRDQVEFSEFRRWIGVADAVWVQPVAGGWSVVADVGGNRIECVKRRGGIRTWASLDRVHAMVSDAGGTEFRVITGADLFGAL